MREGCLQFLQDLSVDLASLRLRYIGVAELLNVDRLDRSAGCETSNIPGFTAE